jgi:carboxypeptidase Q
MRRRDLAGALATAPLAVALRALAQTSQGDIDQRIRREGLERSQVLRTMHFLSDVYGPRLTATPNAKLAGEWALRQMTAWGMTNAHLEPWDFGYAGWANERAVGFITAPVRQQLYVSPAGWTPGTDGVVRGEAVLIDPPQDTTREALAGYLASVRSRVKGRMVMTDAAAPVPIDFDPQAYRLDDQTLARYLHPPPRAPEPPLPAGRLAGRQRNMQIDLFLKAAGALVRLRDSQRPYGELQAFANYAYDPAKAPTTVGLRNEDYGRIARLLADGTPVRLEFDIRNRAFPDGRTAYNAVAEIPGSDRADEVVMLGAHLDSWHLATGATDNGVGCAIMMEAARILRAVGLKPRRTVRVALWTGEEQGLYGSQAYVAEHFGTAEDPKPEFSKLSAYLNIDDGTGRVRALSVFGPEAAADVVRGAIGPLTDLGVVGANPHGVRRLRSTDSTTFSRAGLPAIGLSQDPTDNPSAWHSNLDTYERVLVEDAKQAAVVAATLAQALSVRDDLLPRFAPASMPSAEGPAPSLHPAAADLGRV